MRPMGLTCQRLGRVFNDTCRRTGRSGCFGSGRVFPTPHLRWPCWTGPVKHGFVARPGDWPQPPYRRDRVCSVVGLKERNGGGKLHPTLATAHRSNKIAFAEFFDAVNFSK